MSAYERYLARNENYIVTTGNEQIEMTSCYTRRMEQNDLISNSPYVPKVLKSDLEEEITPIFVEYQKVKVKKLNSKSVI